MKYFTTSLHFLQVLSTTSSHFQCAGPSHICSVYSWVVYIFGCKCKCDCLHFFLLISFFAHKNETDFCPLFLYPAILLYLFIICNSYLVEYSTHRIVLCQKVTILLLHSPHICGFSQFLFAVDFQFHSIVVR